MKTKRSNDLGASLRGFFCDYLPHLRGMSSHTVLSYRDSIKLLLQFLAKEKNASISDLDIKNIGADEIITFLDNLEKNRHNGISTRNVRLSAIHSFFRYLAGTHPEHIDRSQRILSIPFKRTHTRIIEYLEFEEIMTVLQAVDRSKPDGRRNYILLALMFNTGARVQEIVDLKANDLQLSRPFSICIHGKGRKERICPIWEQTAMLLHEYTEERGIDIRQPVTVFINHLGTPLTRFGVRYILAKYLRNAAVVQPSLGKKRLHPHCMRHSTAVHLLKSGVDLSTIGHWLGHVSVNTTNRYVSIDLEMKRKAIAKAKPPEYKTCPAEATWKRDPNIIEWLDSL